MSSIIVAAIFVAPHVDPPIVALAWGVAVGVAQLTAADRAARARLAMLPRRAASTGATRACGGSCGRWVPRFSVSPRRRFHALINTQLAAYLGDGRISWISYADRLMEFPSAMLGVALGTVLLPQPRPSITTTQTKKQYRSLLDWGLRLTFLLALPAALCVGAACRAADRHAVSIRPLHGQRCSGRRALRCSATASVCIGLIAVKILAPGFYARQNMKTPVKIAFLTVLVTQTPRGHR